MIAIDPGISAGYAIFQARDLVMCGIVDDDKSVQQHDRVVFEHPTIYPGSKNPNNIITLAIRTGRLIERFLKPGGVVMDYLPRSWKGQVPKSPKLADYIMYHRIVAKLLPGERRVLAQVLAQQGAQKPMFDIVDAVGLGLHDLGRL